MYLITINTLVYSLSDFLLYIYIYIYIQLILEQHGFELHVSIYTDYCFQ